MTRYIAAYDTEQPQTCLAACRAIRAAHERHGFPATFFLVGRLLEAEGAEYDQVLGECGLFEIASHTYSHRMLRDHPFCGPAVPPEERVREIRLGKQVVEDTFARPCLGLRPGCGFSDGLRGDPWLLGEISATGFRYTSSQLWGPETSLPALLVPPYPYAAEGFPTLWEFPAHGWHENVLKAHNLTTTVQRLVAWPLPWPELLPPGPIRTPEDEFATNRLVIDRALALDLPYVTLIWHPWSLARFDPAMRMLDLTFSYVREMGLQPATFSDLLDK
jgi:peptidoglycan/xylan/chitin deacetylase (PgdA/CDA1 family)